MLKDYFIGELDESSIPELEIFSKNQPSQKNFTDLAKQYWALPVAVATVSIIAGIIYLRRRWTHLKILDSDSNPLDEFQASSILFKQNDSLYQ